MDVNHFHTVISYDKHLQYGQHYTLRTCIMPVTTKGLSDEVCLTLVPLYSSSSVRCCKLSFCNVINSQIINKVCVVAVAPHSYSTHTQLQHVVRTEKLHTRQYMECAIISMPVSRACMHS